MLKMILTVAACAFGVQAEMVGDFNPLKVGDRWIYKQAISLGTDYGYSQVRRHWVTVDIIGSTPVGDSVQITKRTLASPETLFTIDGSGTRIDSTFPGSTKTEKIMDWPERHLVDAKRTFWIRPDSDSVRVIFTRTRVSTPYQTRRLEMQGIGLVDDWVCQDCGFYGGTPHTLSLVEFNGKPVDAARLVNLAFEAEPVGIRRVQPSMAAPEGRMNVRAFSPDGRLIRGRTKAAIPAFPR
jgi:hypothetical protein